MTVKIRKGSFPSDKSETNTVGRRTRGHGYTEPCAHTAAAPSLSTGSPRTFSCEASRRAREHLP